VRAQRELDGAALAQRVRAHGQRYERGWVAGGSRNKEASKMVWREQADADMTGTPAADANEPVVLRGKYGFARGEPTLATHWGNDGQTHADFARMARSGGGKGRTGVCDVATAREHREKERAWRLGARPIRQQPLPTHTPLPGDASAAAASVLGAGSSSYRSAPGSPPPNDGFWPLVPQPASMLPPARPTTSPYVAPHFAAPSFSAPPMRSGSKRGCVPAFQLKLERDLESRVARTEREYARMGEVRGRDGLSNRAMMERAAVGRDAVLLRQELERVRQS